MACSAPRSSAHGRAIMNVARSTGGGSRAAASLRARVIRAPGPAPVSRALDSYPCALGRALSPGASAVLGRWTISSIN